jgi:Domain of unknown function (DUF4262)
MTSEDQRKRALDRISRNITEYGFHTYVVTGGGDPRYAYTIGLSQSSCGELIIAGAYFYSLDELSKIIDGIAAQLKQVAEWNGHKIALYELGSFELRKLDQSWTTVLMLGALDFYQVKEITAFQIVPDRDHYTVDVPDLSRPWDAKTALGWRWIHEKWAYHIPVNSMAITNLGALRGERITEVMRWEEDEWEIFAGAGPDVPQEERRVVPLGVLLGADESLLPATNLTVGTGLWRNDVSEWHPWGNSDGVNKEPTAQ